MKLSVSDLGSLDEAMARAEYPDYVYTYPPRQAYRRLTRCVQETRSIVRTSLADRPDVNLYIHIPFCRQVCRFCNLYTTTGQGDDSVRDQYINRVLVEAASYVEEGLLPQECRWRTLYLGGGTPSVLSIAQLDRLVSGVRRCFSITAVEETAIEVAPETASPQYLRGLRAAGFDRVSMGFQSTLTDEVRSIGRSYPISRQAEIAAVAIDAGFRNLCLDLIFGLPGQDTASWRRSVREVIDMRPHTICCYQWTSRPHTGFHRMGLTKPGGRWLRELYELACAELAAAGYEQETHVRWVTEGGGYLQKQYHWGLQTLIGLGAGARSYLWHTDLRNGYSLLNRRQALNSYLSSAGPGWEGPLEGYEMSADERRRKAMVLGLHELRREWYFEEFGEDALVSFPKQIHGLAERRLVDVTADVIRLTERGRSHRDAIVQLFFSDLVRSRVQSWTYDE
ncbi:MAG TPA: radical SAM protein [Streptosporangiaceae bacterium]|nr:radical SAM protein [Streptosporangiaceae bacterium]